MEKEDARRMFIILSEISIEEDLSKGKGATNSALIAYAHGVNLSLNKLDGLLEVFIKAGIIHKKLIGERYYYRLGES